MSAPDFAAFGNSEHFPWVEMPFELAVVADEELTTRVDETGQHWRTVIGEVWSPWWGIYYDPGFTPCWVLTHLPTGRGVATAWTDGELREVARRLRMLPMPWQSADPEEFDTPEYRALIASVPYLESTAARRVR